MTKENSSQCHRWFRIVADASWQRILSGTLSFDFQCCGHSKRLGNEQAKAKDKSRLPVQDHAGGLGTADLAPDPGVGRRARQAARAHSNSHGLDEFSSPSLRYRRPTIW